MDSKQANRIRSNGIAQAREDSRWMRKRIAELEAERRELIELVRKIRDWPHHSPMRAEAQGLAREALAKIDAQENSDG